MRLTLTKFSALMMQAQLLRSCVLLRHLQLESFIVQPQAVFISSGQVMSRSFVTVFWFK
jgi:hypothetical protein